LVSVALLEDLELDDGWQEAKPSVVVLQELVLDAVWQEA